MNNTKKCTKCHNAKNLSEFSFHKKRNKYNSACRECETKRKLKYYFNNKENCKNSAKIAQRKWSARNPNYSKSWREDHKNDSKQYYIENKNTIASNQKEYKNKRRAIDPFFKLRTYLSSAISNKLRSSQSSKKDKSILEFLPYSSKELKNHLEVQFEPWMTWENHGKYNIKTWDDNNQKTWTWNLDHIIPQSLLSYTSMEEENFQKCWALENLRPYSSKQNVIDGNRRI